jgi:NAD(P)H-flavin reductase
VIPAVSHEPGSTGLHGMLPEVVRQHGSWQDSEVFVSGPPGMVRSTLRVLAHRTPRERIHLDVGGVPAPGQAIRPCAIAVPTHRQ